MAGKATTIDAPIIINEPIKLNIDIETTITYKQNSPDDEIKP